jgi:hypothetical protein
LRPNCLHSPSNTAQSSTDAFPQTSYLQQTNSLGVVTGGPAVETSIPSQPAADTSIPSQPDAVTSQPAVVTSQPLVVTSLPPGASIPAQASGIHTVVIPIGNNSTTQVVVSANNSTTIVYAPSTPATDSAGRTTGAGRPTGSAATGSDATGSDATGTGAQTTETPGAAANMQVASGFLGAALLAAFL